MAIDRCNNCGSPFLAVKEQTYGCYEVPVLKCTSCNTVFGVVYEENVSDEIENIKNFIQSEIVRAVNTQRDIIQQLNKKVSELEKIIFK